MSTENEVRKASNQFYASLNQMLNGDAQSLSDIWSHGSTATTLHPIGGRQVGWDEIQQSWEQVAQIASDGKVELKDQFIHTIGDVACETGTEHGAFKLAGQKVDVQARVTNIYQKVNGTWKIIHHHTDITPSMVDIIGRLQSS